MIKVLIADDEKKICRLIEMLCDWESLGMEIIGYVHNGPEAIEMISEKKPDILIVDIRMPGCDGIEVIRRAREMNLSMEVIIISGYADFAYAKAAITQGVSAYLLKPIKQNELEEAVNARKNDRERQSGFTVATSVSMHCLPWLPSRRKWRDTWRSRVIIWRVCIILIAICRFGRETIRPDLIRKNSNGWIICSSS